MGFHGQLRLAAMLGEGDDRNSVDQGIAVSIDGRIGKDQALRRNDLTEGADHRIIGAVRRAHDDA